MPRPPVPRRISRGLSTLVFKPRGVPTSGLSTLELTLDGLEALRLADQEGLYQEEAARRMGVSRATFARIVAEARRTVAKALLERKALVVRGGTVEREERQTWPCPVHGHRHRQGRGCRCQKSRPRGGEHGNAKTDDRDRE